MCLAMLLLVLFALLFVPLLLVITLVITLALVLLVFTFIIVILRTIRYEVILFTTLVAYSLFGPSLEVSFLHKFLEISHHHGRFFIGAISIT